MRQEGSHWLKYYYGTNVTRRGASVQNYGSVKTPKGRLLAFPNTFHHRVSSFRLADPTKPGHRRFIALWLVDPHCPTISTANVPPQQQNFGQSLSWGDQETVRRRRQATCPHILYSYYWREGLHCRTAALQLHFPLNCWL